MPSRDQNPCFGYELGRGKDGEIWWEGVSVLSPNQNPLLAIKWGIFVCCIQFPPDKSTNYTDVLHIGAISVDRKVYSIPMTERQFNEKKHHYGRTDHHHPGQRAVIDSLLCYHHCRYGLKLFHCFTNQHPPFGSARPCSIPSWFYPEVAPRIRLYQRLQRHPSPTPPPSFYQPVSAPGSLFWIHL